MSLSEYTLASTNERIISDARGNIIKRIGAKALDREADSSSERAKGVRQTFVLASGSDHPLVADLDRHRAGYVRRKGWMPADHFTDFDRYDSAHARTLSFVETAVDSNGEEGILSSFRLTGVDKAEDCLSFEMVDLNFDEELSESQQAHLKSVAHEGALYDLTRLLPPQGESVSRREYLASIVKLFGLGFHHTAIQPNQAPTWVCASEPGLRSMLLRLGIASEVLKEARRDVPRNHQAVLYQIEPLKALQSAIEEGDKFAFGLENFRIGLEEARLTPVK